MSVKYQAIAQSAVDYVRSVMTLGALNKLGDVIGSRGKSVICVMAERSVEKEWSSLQTESLLRRVAAAAEENGCGNCGEQSAVAFVYLLDHRVRPIDWMALQKPGDHNFVVIGRVSGSDDTDPGTWGPAAIVCDPWKGKVYPPSMIVPMWKHKPHTNYRAD